MPNNAQDKDALRSKFMIKITLLCQFHAKS